MDTNEFLAKFERTYGTNYEYEWDEDLGQIYLSYSKKLDYALDCLRIEFSENTFSIYREFLYLDHYGPFLVVEICKDEILFSESIKSILGQEPERSYEDGLGCPFFANRIGFFCIPFSWEELDQKIDLITRAYPKIEELSLSDITISSDTQLQFEECKQHLINKLKDVAPFLCHTHIKDSPLNRDHTFDYVHSYLNRSNTILVGVGLDNLQLLCVPTANTCSFYSGFRYHIVSVNGCNLIYDLRLVKSVIDAFSKVDEECDIDSFLKYSIDSKFRLVITCGEMWAAICRFEPDNYEKFLTYEKNELKKLEQEFLAVAPEHFWNRSFDFATLSDQQFESLCRDLLLSMNFRNIQVRGNIRAADGGIDITAEEEYQTLIGPEKRKWIFQCKHTKQQINRKDLSEVRDLLKEFQADCYGIFYSGFFSPSTLDRINHIRETDQIMIKGWDHNDLELELSKRPELATKYFGV